MDEWCQLWLVEIGLSVVACHAGCRAWTSTLSDDDRGKETVIRDANLHRRWCCELYRRSLQHVDSKLRRGTWMDRRTGQLLVVTEPEARTPPPRRLAVRTQAREDNEHMNEFLRCFSSPFSVRSRWLCGWRSDTGGNNSPSRRRLDTLQWKRS